ncbi:hypothetical protein [Streptomyces sp. NBC_01481]|uniref:hypothetical protein n=1 Tax=Streptomyces sp. NBC_01481 TaxID=2975869 RepID=UPI002259DCDF|nr:hypothetical protein [Streptomyces sp. NBC_01481]MCX4585624.1 hypothetical protein [Streptomyces sp. NBC_01481]
MVGAGARREEGPSARNPGKREAATGAWRYEARQRWGEVVGDAQPCGSTATKARSATSKPAALYGCDLPGP